MKNAILTGAVVFMLGLIVSCSPTSHKAKELTAKGYTVCEHEKGLWYYNADSVFYYDAEKMDFMEYGATEITADELKDIVGFDLAAEIEAEGYQVDNILKRGNGIVNVNYSKEEKHK